MNVSESEIDDGEVVVEDGISKNRSRRKAEQILFEGDRGG